MQGQQFIHNGLNIAITPIEGRGGPVAQWIRHLTTNQGIPGSSPGRVVFLQGYSFLIISFLSPNMSIFTSFLGLNAKKIYI